MTKSKPLLSSLAGLITVFNLWLGAAGTAEAADAKASPMASAFQRLVKEKRALEERLARKHGQEAPSLVWDFFEAAGRGGWAATSNLFQSLHSDFPASPFLGAVNETYGVCEKMETWNPGFFQLLSAGILKGIPSGSIYFGGNDAALFGPILQSVSHGEGRPFFTLSQNGLADKSYRGYARGMYGDKIRIPDDDEAARCLAQYTEDAGRRLKHDQEFPGEPKQIRPGEDVGWVDGKVQIQGHVSLMALNALLAKGIFEKNPGRDFYYVESFPLDWLYPHLAPHQFVFKVQRQPAAELSGAVVRADREFWSGHADKWVGPWLRPNTPVSSLTNFVVRTFFERSLEQFHGDPNFIKDKEARRFFAHLRGSVGGFYAWRAGIAKSEKERQRMLGEADFAFQQAFVFCPESPVAVFRYVNLLVSAGRIEDSLAVAGVARRMDSKNQQFEVLLSELARRAQKTVR